MLGKQMRGKKETVKTFFFLGVKGENNGSSYPGDCMLPTKKRKAKEKKNKNKRTKRKNREGSTHF